MNELYRQEEEKRKKADEIMKQIGESIENCHLFKVDPNMVRILQSKFEYIYNSIFTATYYATTGTY